MHLYLTKYNYICRNYSLLCRPLNLHYVSRRYMKRATGFAARATPTPVLPPKTLVHAQATVPGRTTHVSSFSRSASYANGVVSAPVTRTRPPVYPRSLRDYSYVAHSKGASSKLLASDTTGTPTPAEAKLRSRPRSVVASNSNNAVPRTSKVPVSDISNSTASADPKNVIPLPPAPPMKPLVKPRDNTLPLKAFTEELKDLSGGLKKGENLKPSMLFLPRQINPMNFHSAEVTSGDFFESATSTPSPTLPTSQLIIASEAPVAVKPVSPVAERNKIYKNFWQEMDFDARIAQVISDASDVSRNERAGDVATMLLILEKYKLYEHDENAGEKLRKEACKYLTRKCNGHIQLNLAEEGLLNNLQIRPGLLEVVYGEVTVLLDTLHKHVDLFTPLKNGTLLLWGSLTSDARDTDMIIADYQPFSDGNNANKKQYLYLCDPPLIVKFSEIKALPECVKSNADKYFNDNAVASKLKEHFEKYVYTKLDKPVPIYDGKGLTLLDLNEIWSLHQKAEDKQARFWYNKYNFKPDNEKEDYLNSLAEVVVHKLAYEYLLDLINHGQSNK